MKTSNVVKPVSYVLDNFVNPKVGVKEVSTQVYSETLDTTFDVYVNSQRYILFKRKGVSCVCCGMTATRCELTCSGG